MAKRAQNGRRAFLFIDPANGTDWQIPICLTGNTFNGTTATNNVSNKCENSSTPGDQSSTWNVAGQIYADPATGEIDIATLFTLWQDATTFAWKLDYETPTAGDVVKTGHGYFSSYSEDYQTAATFSGTIANTGDIVQSISSGS